LTPRLEGRKTNFVAPNFRMTFFKKKNRFNARKFLMTIFSHRRYFVDFHCKITIITSDPLFFLFFTKNSYFILPKDRFSQFVLCLYLRTLDVRSRPIRLVRCTGLGSNKQHAGRSQHRIVTTILGHIYYIYVLSSNKSHWHK